MALDAKTKETLKTVYKIDVDKLVAAVTDPADVAVELPENVVVMATADLDTRDANNKAAAKREGETIGEVKGKELAAKAFKKKFNITDEAVGNDVDKVVEAVNTTIAKGDAGLKEQIVLLQTDKATLEKQVQEADTKAKAAGFDAQLISFFPPNRSADLNDNERLTLVKMGLEFAEENGQQVVKKGGVVLRDTTTQAPIPVKDAIASLFTERKWVAEAAGGPGGGRGGKDNPGGAGGAGIKTLTAFTEKWAAENPGGNPAGAEAMDAMAAHAKDMPDFDWHA